MAGAELQFQFDWKNRDGISCDFNAFQTKADNEGRFVFTRVPPGNGQVMLVTAGTDQMGRKYWSSSPLQKVTIHSGETATITIGGSNQDGQ